MITRKRILAALSGTAVLAAVVALAACSSATVPAGQQKEFAQQQADTNSLMQAQPLPHFNFSQIRQTLIDAETISAEGTQTTSFFFPQGGTGETPVFSCPSLGLPVAANAQLSNPNQVIVDPNNTYNTNNPGSLTVPQMDPNGIYSSPSSLGTYVICLLNSGQKYLTYWEGPVYSVTGSATWANGTIQVNGAPTFKVTAGSSNG